MYSKESFQSPAARMPTILQRDDKGVPEKIGSFVTEYTDGLLQAAKQEEQRFESEPGTLLTDTLFKIHVLTVHQVAHKLREYRFKKQKRYFEIWRIL